MFVRISIASSLLLLVACSQDQTVNTDNLISDNLVTFDSCDIAMSSDNRIEEDAKIRQYQNAVAHAIQPIVNLEKLGWSYVSLARRTYDNGYYNLALETSKCIESISAGDDAALMLRAYISHQLHNFKDAEQLSQQLVRERGYWFEYGLLGDALMEQGQLEAAEQAYQSMMNQRPGPQAYSRAAHLRWLKGDLPGAIEMAQLAVETYGYGKSETASWAKTRLGYYFLLNGELDRAGKIIEQTIKLNPNYAPALFLKGRIHLSQGNPDAAIYSINKATELNPLAEYLWVLIEVLESTNKYEQAKLVQSQFEKKAGIEDPRTYALYLATSTKNKTLALELARQELERRRDIFSHDAMAWSLYANNKIPQALTHLENALRFNTHDARLFYHAALIYLSANDISEANKWFGKAHTNQHMLLPSERTELQTKFAKFQSHNTPLKTQSYVSRD